MLTLGGSASDALTGLLGAARRPARVVGSGPFAAYLATHDGEVVAVVTADAVRLPCAIVLAPGTPVPPWLHPGATAVVGAAAVQAGAGTVRVHRWWRAPTVTPRPISDVGRRALADRLQGHALPDGVATALRRAGRCLARGDGPGAADHLVPVLGLGAGLTPSADDAVAGLLLGAVGKAVHEAAVLVGRAAPARTTAVSAALLQHAARGRAAAPVVRAHDALTGRGDLTGALDALWALGHTSGADTAAGLLTAAMAEPAVRRAA